MRKITEKRRRFPDPSLNALADRVLRGESDTKVCGLHESAMSFVLSVIFKDTKKTFVVVTQSREEADNIFRDLTFFLGEEFVSLFPSDDLFYPGDVFPYRREIAAQRIHSLFRLLSGKPAIVIVPLKALMQRVMPADVFMDCTQTVSVGDDLDRDRFTAKLISSSYKRVPLVEEKGEFSIRGYIIDIFSPAADRPVRMEFMGDEIESIRELDVTNQRSAGEMKSFVLSPAGELILSDGRKERALKNLINRANELSIPKAKRDHLVDIMENELGSFSGLQFLPLFYGYDSGDEKSPDSAGIDTIFDYIPGSGVVVYDDVNAIKKMEGEIVNDVDHFLEKAENEERFYMDKEFFHVPLEELFRKSNDFSKIYIENFQSESQDAIEFKTERHVGLKQELPQGEGGMLEPIAKRIRKWTDDGNLVNFLCAESEVHRMMNLLREYALPAEQTDLPVICALDGHGNRGRLFLRAGRITEGFVYPSLKLVVVGEEEIFGKKLKRRRKSPAAEGYFLKSFGELKENDYIVHVDHGIGIYRGLNHLTIGGTENDFILMEYLGGDRLYIPVERLDQIQRYIGPDGYIPNMDKLGGTSWEAVKRRVKKSVREIAEELVSIYAAREVMEGHRFAPHARDYEEFASSFEFEETPDQMRAIEDIIQDMTDPRPMDRLICGDAGFGKTEVALRASFMAAIDGKQVAVLVPTTILAEQHYQTFVRRLGKYPFRVEVLNRFKTGSQQKKIVEDINKGLVDIVVGTHRILQKDVKFKDLGLVVVDEEHRFGVSDKEKLKKIRTLVDVIMLTATPIPRTLQLSLIGIRDLSIIDTPPEDRKSVRIRISEFDEDIIKNAIEREMERGGQVFFVHDRIGSIYSMARAVGKLVPTAEIGVAHGRMKAHELEDVMVGFLSGKYNVLVCTTIIGSGLDVPSANTIIINRADKFGLSQLYQLRGRIGRSKEDAYAYLLVPEGVMLSRDAKKRLRVAQEFSEPGSGFKVAAHDLEIRGAGNLLGVSQSGHVSAVGYELYTELMDKAVRELRGEEVHEEEISPEVNFGIPAFIPDDFISDMHARLVTYKKISLAASEEDLLSLKEELMDCYGFIPPQVSNLMDIISTRNLLKHIMAKRMEYNGKVMSVVFHEKSPIDPMKILKLAQKKFKGLKLTPDLRLSVPMPGLAEGEIIEKAKSLIRELS